MNRTPTKYLVEGMFQDNGEAYAEQVTCHWRDYESMPAIDEVGKAAAASISIFNKRRVFVVGKVTKLKAAA